jgi:hypothetical protein
MISAASASAAALSFISDEGGELVGEIGDLPGDKATATADRAGRLFVIFVQRGAEAIKRAPDQPSALRK